MANFNIFIDLKFGFILDWIVGATEQKVIKLVGNVIWVSKKFTLIVKNYFGRFRFFSVYRNY